MTRIIKEKILSTYEELADGFNAKADYKPQTTYHDDRPNILNLIPDVDDKWVLDAACGPGKYAEKLLERGAKLIGFDRSPRMVELAQIRNKGNGHFFVHDLSNRLGMFESSSFEVVVCALAMHYVKNWDQTIQEFHRVLKPTGQLIISIEHPFFEYNYFESSQYFSVEPVKAVWKGFDKPVEVNSFRRPLNECIEPFTNNGFYIDKLVEPRPNVKNKEAAPKQFTETNIFPSFMCIRAVKK